jgi:hypothetical protein
VRDDHPSHTSPRLTNPPPPAAVVRPFLTWWNLALAVLVPGTSLAIASVSAWLVVPYLLLIGSLVLSPLGRGQIGAQARSERQRASTEPYVSSGRLSLARRTDCRDSATEPEGPLELDSGEVTVAEASSSRSRRGRGRARAKPKPEPLAPTNPSRATWVRVGPGKFVRVETPEIPGDSTVAPPDAPAASALPSPHWDEAASPSETEADDASANQAALAEQTVPEYSAQVPFCGQQACGPAWDNLLAVSENAAGSVQPEPPGLEVPPAELALDEFTDAAESAQADQTETAGCVAGPENSALFDGTVLDEDLELEPNNGVPETEIRLQPLDDEDLDETKESDEPAIPARGLETELGGLDADSPAAGFTQSIAEASGAFLFGRGHWTAARRAIGEGRSIRSHRSAWPRRVGRQLHCHLRRSSGRNDRMARTFQSRAPPSGCNGGEKSSRISPRS